jgi:hypothetical protein
MSGYVGLKGGSVWCKGGAASCKCRFGSVMTGSVSLNGAGQPSSVGLVAASVGLVASRVGGSDNCNIVGLVAS